MFDGVPGDFSGLIERRRSRLFIRAGRWLRLCLDRRRQRRALAGLDDRMLVDIGITRGQAAAECAKPFWR